MLLTTGGGRQGSIRRAAGGGGGAAPPPQGPRSEGPSYLRRADVALKGRAKDGTEGHSAWHTVGRGYSRGRRGAVGKDEMHRWENLIGPFLVHHLLGLRGCSVRRARACPQRRLFSTAGSHGSQGPELSTPDAVLNGSCTPL